VLAKKLQYGYSSLKKDKSYFTLLRDYLHNNQWTDLGMSLVMGMTSGKTASSHEFMCLPDYIFEVFEKSSIKTSIQVFPLVKETNILLPWKSKSTSIPFYLDPFNIFMFIFVLVLILSYFNFRKKNFAKWFDYPFFISLGIFSLISLFMWFISDHSATNQNLNILWTFPTHLFIVSIFKKSFAKSYFLIFAGISAMFLILWKSIPQDLHIAIIPLVGILMIRSFVNYSVLSKKD
jgi:hypothetical protein